MAAQLKGLVITGNAQTRATQNKEYVKVTSDPKAKGVSMVKITGATRQWKENPDFIYVPMYLTAGREHDVRQALLAAGIDPTAALQGAIRLSNYQQSTEYKRQLVERKELTAAQTRAKPRVPDYTLDDVLRIGELLKQEVRIVPRPKRAVSPRARSPRGPRQNILQKLQALKAGFVLNVSKITDAGGDIKRKPEVKELSRTKFRFVPGLPQVVSDNAAALDKAIRMLAQFQGGEGYQQFVGRVTADLFVPVAKRAAPARLPPAAMAPVGVVGTPGTFQMAPAAVPGLGIVAQTSPLLFRSGSPT